MEADCFFRMGSTHSVCQDYAETRTLLNGGVRVAVSDGCSSARYTDFGARFLVRAASLLYEVHETGVLQLASHMSDAAKLPRESLQATLLTADFHEDKGWTVYRAGDGLIVYRFTDGRVAYNTIAYDNNIPAYLSYLLNEEDHRAFLGTVSGITSTICERESNGRWGQRDTFREEARIGGDIGYPVDVDLVLLFSDGIESFQDRDGALVPVESILDELLSIKNFKGQFLSRRCGSFLSRTCVERGWKHADDFSVAGIYVG